jgi:hypothetical protein
MIGVVFFLGVLLPFEIFLSVLDLIYQGEYIFLKDFLFLFCKSLNRTIIIIILI